MLWRGKTVPVQETVLALGQRDFKSSHYFSFFFSPFAVLLKASFQYRFPSLCVFLLSKEASKETFALEWCLLQPTLHSTGRAGEGVGQAEQTVQQIEAEVARQVTGSPLL